MTIGRVVRTVLVLTLAGMAAAPVRAQDGGVKRQGVVKSGAGSLPKLVLINPGTKVGTDAPHDWSHLVIKSLPALESGDLASLPSMAKSTATMFRTVLTADVRKGAQERFELRRIGLGICTPVRGADVVVSSSSLDALGVSLGFIPRRVLVRSEEELVRGRLQAKTPTFALYSAPISLKARQSHIPVILKYAFLVDADTGALRTLLWPVAADPEARRAPRSLIMIPPSLTFTCGLDVVSQRFLQAIPTDWSFAMAKLPPGERVALPANLPPWTVRDRLGLAESAALEAELRLIPNLFAEVPRQEVVSQDTNIHKVKARVPSRPVD